LIGLGLGIALMFIGLLGPLSAAASAETLTVAPEADTYVSSASPGTSYGGSSYLKVDGSPIVRSYLRFNVQLPADAVVNGATLRLYTTTASTSSGFYVSSVTSTTWGEYSTTYRTAPSFGVQLAKLSSWSSTGWKTVALPSGAVKRGKSTFGLGTGSGSGKTFRSRTASSYRPQLIVDYTVPLIQPPKTPCRDGLDNDGDDKLDYPDDPGCHSVDDVEEADRCPEFGSAATAGTVNFAAAKELSGLAASRRNPGVLWTHNDSGDTERVFAMDTSGRLIATYNVSANLQQDWEDIAVGPGPDPARSYLYIGSIGGNAGRHSLYVYRAPEPQTTLGTAPYASPLDSVVKLPIHYPGTEDYNAEALMVDPLTGDIYVVTKDSLTSVARVFRYPAGEHDPSVDFVLHQVATVQFPGPVTAGDISGDGREIVLKGYDRSYLWQRPAGTSVASALSATACRIPQAIGESKGEAIAFSPDAAEYYTLSEGSSMPLHRFSRLQG
jgi:hypothetical protein